MAERTIIKRGETFRRSLRLSYAKTGTRVDLSDCSVFCQMRTAPSGMLIATAACSINHDTSTIYVLWSSEATQAMKPGKYGYDVWVVNGNERKPIYTEQVEVVDRYTDNLPVEIEEANDGD